MNKYTILNTKTLMPLSKMKLISMFVELETCIFFSWTKQ